MLFPFENVKGYAKSFKIDHVTINRQLEISMAESADKVAKAESGLR